MGVVNDTLISLSLLATPVLPGTTETTIIDSALIVRGLDYVARIDNIFNVEFYSEDFSQFAYNEAEYIFNHNQAFVIGDVENPSTGEVSTYFIDLYNTNLQDGLLYFIDNDAELFFRNIPSVYVAFRNSTIYNLFNDYVGTDYTSATTSDIIAEYGGIYSNSVVVDYSYWYNLGFEDGYINRGQESHYLSLPWLDVLNQIFTFEFIPGFKLYYMLVFGLGIIAFKAVVKTLS